MRGVPHHLLDEMSSHRLFTAHDFVARASRSVVDISSKGKLPIIVGGTGFYIDALVGRIALPNVPMNPKLRKRLEKMTAEQLFVLLKKRDSRRAKTIDRHNKRRLVRALEIASAEVDADRHAGRPVGDRGIDQPRVAFQKLVRIVAALPHAFAHLGVAQIGEVRVIEL